MATAELLKEEGNRHFQSGDFAGAEGLYSKAIIANPKNPVLYTNRAMARLKLKLWESVIADCCTSLELLPRKNMKAHYYSSQAQIELHDYAAALAHAQHAHQICVETKGEPTSDRSLGPVTALVLRCRKEKWDDDERRRVREDGALETEVVRLLQREMDDALTSLDPSEEGRREIMAEYEAKIARVRHVFENSRSNTEKMRKVPDWAIDDIGFGFMVDPVITKTGKSYERATIMEHLRRHSTDPLTREPLLPTELRPNLGLKQACEEFLAENGWAADW